MTDQIPLTINGWTLYLHPLMLNEIELLIQTVETLKYNDPVNYVKKNATKRLAAIHKLMFDVIPQDPARNEYRQGNTLGSSRKHWFRAKFFQQYRLFFRFDSTSKLILYAWVNDENSKRSYDSQSDAYQIFAKMLNNGNPPDNLNTLLEEAKGEQDRYASLLKKL